jgi:excisionase family DNA binding protein
MRVWETSSWDDYFKRLGECDMASEIPELLTVVEVAAELRCSKAHVSKAIAGKLPHVTPLPAIPMGRRKLVRRAALLKWIEENERAMLSESPEHDAVNA